MDTLVASRNKIVVKQRKELGEILFGFETRNRYDLLDESGTPIGQAAEEGGGIGTALLRNFLGSGRACTLHILDNDGKELGRGVKPFRFFFYAYYPGSFWLPREDKSWLQGTVRPCDGAGS